MANRHFRPTSVTHIFWLSGNYAGQSSQSKLNKKHQVMNRNYKSLGSVVIRLIYLAPNFFSHVINNETTTAVRKISAP